MKKCAMNIRNQVQQTVFHKLEKQVKFNIMSIIGHKVRGASKDQVCDQVLRNVFLEISS